MPSKQRHPSTLQHTVFSVPTTIFKPCRSTGHEQRAQQKQSRPTNQSRQVPLETDAPTHIPPQQLADPFLPRGDRCHKKRRERRTHKSKWDPSRELWQMPKQEDRYFIGPAKTKGEQKVGQDRMLAHVLYHPTRRPFRGIGWR